MRIKKRMGNAQNHIYKESQKGNKKKNKDRGI